MYASEYLAKSELVYLDDTSSLFHIDAADWKALNEFIENYLGATKYKYFHDWIVAFGFEILTHRPTGWSASIANVHTFINHSCSEEEVKTAACEFIFVNEDNKPIVECSPVIYRHPFMPGTALCVVHSINVGDKVAMDRR